MKPILSVTIPNYGGYLPRDGWRRYLDLARAAEDAGIGRLVTVDHVVMGRNTGAYSWGTFPGSVDEPWLEPLTLLTAVAAVTSRIRLATGILIAPLRPAPLLAKTAATLDLLSEGRLDLGVGVGWQREEYEASGLGWESRGAALTASMAACKAMWTRSPAVVAGTEVWCEPKPVQPGGVPLWISGTLRRANVERLVAHGDGWIPIMGETLDGIRDGAALLRAAFKDAGRDPAELRVQASVPVARGDDGRPDLERSMAEVPALVEAGGTAVNFFLTPFCPDPGDAPAVFARAAALFEAAL